MSTIFTEELKSDELFTNKLQQRVQRYSNTWMNINQ